MKQLKGLIAFFAFVSVFAACKKEYSREKDNGANTLSQWEFKEGATQYNGSVDTAFVDTTGGIQFLTIEGTSLDRSKKISLGVFSQDLKAGTYSSPTAFIDFLDNGAVVYESDITAIGQFTIVISKIDSIGVSGTFSGKVKDSNGNPKDIVNGKFNAKFKTSAVTPPAGDGQLTLWSKAGCSPGATAIQVSVNGSNGTITSFQAAEPACATAGTYTVTLPAGTYTWTATCGAVTITGSVTVTAGGCTRGQVDFTAPVATNCKISNIILYDGSGDAEYAYKASYTGNLVTKWEAIDSISNTVDAAFNLTRPAGKIQLDANQYLVVNGNGRVTEFRGYEDPRDPNSLPIIVKYTYNGNGQLTQRTEELQQLPGQVYFTFTYTWSGNLLTKVQGKTGNQLFYEDVYEYDALKTVKNGIILHSFAAEIFMLQSVANFGVAPDKAFTKITQKTFDPLQGTILTTSIATFDQYVIDAAGFVQSFRLNDAALEGLGFGVMPTGTYKLFYNCP